ncbi:MAG: 1-acyl-sn-glycerol-3-phosphate acyltransferase [Planctomycetota bacterium]|nr:MAG: 1-acyl-sn-glycerol-3-phosphate acyltransferase [Planctomycetota bacterium]
MKAPLHGMATSHPPLPADARRGHSAFGCALYASLWVLTRMFAVSVFGFRVRFAESLPKQGGLLVLSTHQSHLDPLLLGLSCHRRLSSMARSSLYRFKPFAAIITALDAIPIDRESSTVAAMKGVINRLRDGAAVVIFPEGTRTADGKLGELKGGFVLLAKRAGVPIVPVAIVGAWECWPRTRLFPRPGRIRLEFGRLLQPEQIAAMTDGEILSACTAEIKHLDLAARAAWESGRLK